MMNRVAISAEEVPLPAWQDAVKKLVLKTLDKLCKDNWDISVLFCSDNYIRALNYKWRGLDCATDVLAFPLGETIIEDGKERFISGDIVISLETLPVNAAYFGESEDMELRRLLVHGLLHLAGYDHTTNDISSKTQAAEPMIALQESILTELQKERILCANY